MKPGVLVFACALLWAAQLFEARKLKKVHEGKVAWHGTSKPEDDKRADDGHSHSKAKTLVKKITKRRRSKKSRTRWGNKIKRRVRRRRVAVPKVRTGVMNNPAVGAATSCDLSIRVFPLLFYGLSGNVEFRALFRSTCFDYPILKYFMLKFDDKADLSVTSHPSFVQLSIFGRVFNLKFLEAFERGFYPDVNVAYKYVRMNPSKLVMNVNTFEENNMLLNPGTPSKQFRGDEMAKLAAAENPSFCELDQNDTIMECAVA